MGCDINTFVEIHNKNANKWEYYNEPVFTSSIAEGEENEDVPFSWPDYEMFAVLAGVRNNRATIKPIDNPRGMPEDASDEVRAEFKEQYEPYEQNHSAGWLTVADLLAYDYDQKVMYERFDEEKEEFAYDIERTVRECIAAYSLFI